MWREIRLAERGTTSYKFYCGHFLDELSLKRAWRMSLEIRCQSWKKGWWEWKKVAEHLTTEGRSQESQERGIVLKTDCSNLGPQSSSFDLQQTQFHTQNATSPCWMIKMLLSLQNAAFLRNFHFLSPKCGCVPEKAVFKQPVMLPLYIYGVSH